MDKTPEADDMDGMAEPRKRYSPKGIMKRLAQMNKSEWKWIVAAMVTVTLKGTPYEFMRDGDSTMKLPIADGRIKITTRISLQEWSPRFEGSCWVNF